MIGGGFSPLQSPGDTPLILGPHPKSAPSPPQDSPGPCLFSLGLGGEIINLGDKRRDKDHLLKMVSSVMCWREHIQDFPKAGCSATHPQFPVMVSSPPRKKCAPPPPHQLLPGLEVARSVCFSPSHLHSQKALRLSSLLPWEGLRMEMSHPPSFLTHINDHISERAWRGDSQTPSCRVSG